MNETYRRLLQALQQAAETTTDPQTKALLRSALECFVKERFAYVRAVREGRAATV